MTFLEHHRSRQNGSVVRPKLIKALIEAPYQSKLENRYYKPHGRRVARLP